MPGRSTTVADSADRADHPNRNIFIERFIRSIKEECLDRVIPLGEAHLRELIREYIAHYHGERPHQGLSRSVRKPDRLCGSVLKAWFQTDSGLLGCLESAQEFH